MDQTRFDILAKGIARTPRRTVLAAVGAALAAVLAECDGSDATLAKPRRRRHRDRHHGGDTVRVNGNDKKKKACPPCKKRKKGKCKANQPLGTVCEGGNCDGAGNCLPAQQAIVSPPPSPPPTPPDAPPPPPPPPAGPCTGQPNDTACNGDGRCLNGVCNSKPICLGHSEACTSPGVCCVNNCVGGECEGAGHELPLTEECRSSFDCQSFRCVGYRCVQGIFPPGSACAFNARCTTNRCGCEGPNTNCSCRNADCGGVGAPCNPNNPAGRDVQCCSGGCTGVILSTGQTVCA